ncbi:MAG: fimbria/pilus periplasmic chaperone [Gallionellaceae bacterium]|nr:fimbria/pilus periplasmic chaperone [Gallionellaceae bacterium]
MRTQGIVAALAASLWLAATVQAAGIGVLPVGLELSARQDRGVINVTNDAAEAVVVQVEQVAWSRTDGKDHYTPTRDLVVNPPLFTLAPGRTQVLRVGLRRPPTGERERTYRLFVREVPPPSKAPEGEGVGVRVLLELRLPIYVLPAKVVRAQQWQGQRAADGAIEVTARNTGNVHQVVAGLKLRAAGAAADAPILAEAQKGGLLFPGEGRSWTLHPPPDTAASRYVLEVTTERGTQNVVLDLGRE